MSPLTPQPSLEVPESDIALYLTPFQLRGGRVRLKNVNGQACGHSPIGFLSRLSGEGLFSGIVQNGKLRAVRILRGADFIAQSSALAGFDLRVASALLRDYKKKFCDGCRRELSRSQFAKRATFADGVDHRCVYCRHKEAAIESARNKDLRRLRELHAEGSHTLKEWLDCLKRFGFRCVCCGVDATAIEGTLTKDHVVPLLHGGSNFISNIQPLCRPCNSRKGAKTIDYRDNLSQTAHSLFSGDGLSGRDFSREGRPDNASDGSDSTARAHREGGRDRNRIAEPHQAAPGQQGHLSAGGTDLSRVSV
jgi:5-methylcytosine-specific restriction endonuclease McrA